MEDDYQYTSPFHSHITPSPYLFSATQVYYYVGGYLHWLAAHKHQEEQSNLSAPALF